LHGKGDKWEYLGMTVAWHNCIRITLHNYWVYGDVANLIQSLGKTCNMKRQD
jgi:hypothetical protein